MRPVDARVYARVDVHVRRSASTNGPERLGAAPQLLVARAKLLRRLGRAHAAHGRRRAGTRSDRLGKRLPDGDILVIMTIMFPLLICHNDRLGEKLSDGGILVIITIMLPLLICHNDRLGESFSDGAVARAQCMSVHMCTRMCTRMSAISHLRDMPSAMPA